MKKLFFHLKKDLLFFLSLMGFFMISGCSLLSPLFLTHSPNEVYESFISQVPFWMEGGSFQFILGTDDLGRDFMTRLFYGGRISLWVGFVVMVTSSLGGVFLGVVAAVFKPLESWVMGFVNILMSFPGILMAIIVVALLGPSLFNACLAVSVIALPMMIRLVRSLVLKELSLEYVESARSFGASSFRLIFFHILPNCMGGISVQAVLNFSEGILSVAALSFLGLGAQAPLPEWGVMISDGKAYIDTSWWLICFPGFCILILVLCVNVLGEKLREILNPKGKEG